GSSPDGLVGETGGIEIKSPSAKVHVATVLSGAIPDYNRAQAQAFLHVTSREWCDFISYLPGEPLFIIRDYPDERWQNAIVSAAEQFEETARNAVARYKTATHGLPRTPHWDPFDEGEDIYCQPRSHASTARKRGDARSSPNTAHDATTATVEARWTKGLARGPGT